MSNENDHPDSKVSNTTVVLPGGLPAIKPAREYVPPVRQPQLSNADDVAAIVNNRNLTASIEPLLAGFRRLLIDNLSYVPVVSKLLRDLSAEIANPTDTDDAA